jgi:parvulin-like peptidyl-prolyl isomerase
MKSIAVSVLCLASLCAQTPPQPQANAPAAAPALPDLPDGTTVATCKDGYLITMGELRGLLIAVNNPKALANVQDFLDQWCIMRKLAKLAQEDKLDQQSPYKEQVLWAHTLSLATAELTTQSNPQITFEEAQRYYLEHKAEYEQVKAYDIYIAYSSAGGTGSDGKKLLNRDEAKAKAQSLLDQIRKGADFKKLAKENSEDETSRAKDGFFAELSSTSSGIPESIRAAVFRLKEGETTDVIEQPNGFYLFRADTIAYKPYSEVRDQVDRALKEERSRSWMDGIQRDTKATIVNPKLSGR